ncbi:hypothetical protein LCGC14_1596140 [marine sediment metagenome]|uniref:Uncharacterized protein n=1 Tax=marine sediment metagenome TaxID=412755 RepID=A0A0F9ICX5_9ZZZZ
MTKGGEMYNKGLMVMDTMRRFKCSKEKARAAVEKFLEQENKRVPDVEKVMAEALKDSLN